MFLDEIPEIQRHVPLKGYSTFNVGGPADYYIEIRDLGMLPQVLKSADSDGVPIFVLGSGSNVLFMDEGFRGLVVRIMADEVRMEGKRVVAEAGARWPAILRATQAAGLTGLEPFDGLPGTIGGAVAGNAGCFGLEMKDVLERAMIYDRQVNKIREVEPDYFDFSYRLSRIKENHNVVLSATLRLRPIDQITHNPTAQTAFSSTSPDPSNPSNLPTSLHARLSKQPPGKSSGSFFKNPSPEKPAGWLIDQCGLKGFQIGGAQISPKHSNFFMNMGQATAADILALRDHAKAAVREKFGIILHEEVVIVDLKTPYLI